MSEKFIPVQIKSDEDGHNFIIPNEFDEEFSAAMEKGYLTDDYSEAEKFQKYRIGGSVNNYQLFISESELKKLTGE